MLRTIVDFTKQRPRPSTLVALIACLAQCLAAAAPSAAWTAECSNDQRIQSAVAHFDANDYTRATTTLLLAEKHHQDRALLCFYNLISRKTLGSAPYHNLGIALYKAGTGEAFSIGTNLSAQYLAGSELALRRALERAEGDHDTVEIQLALARSLLEQVASHDHNLLKAETVNLLEAYLEQDSSSATADWARDALRDLEALVPVDPSAAHYLAEAVHVGGKIRSPERTNARLPYHTRDARIARVQGAVTLRAIVDQKGDVVHVEVLKGLPFGLSAASVKAVETWELRPATLHGQPVVVFYNVTINFGLH